MKKIVLLLIMLLLLTACNKEDKESKSTTFSENKISKQEEVFKISNDSKSYLLNYTENKLDEQEIEMGIMDIASSYFDSDKLYIKNGTLLSNKTIEDWTERKPIGFNPSINKKLDLITAEKESPKILSYVSEKNLIDKEKKIKGILVTIVLNEYYTYKVTDKEDRIYSGEVKVDNDEDNVDNVSVFGEKISQPIINEIRKNKKSSNVPILLTLYQKTSSSAITPGNFVKKSYLNPNENKIKNWENINRKKYAFPSEQLSSQDSFTYGILSDMKDDWQENFHNGNIKLTGNALYKENIVTTIDLKVESQMSTVENLSLATYIENYIKNIQPNFPINVALENNIILMWNPQTKEIISNKTYD